MPYDLYMSLGIIVLALVIPSTLSALMDRRMPIASGLLVVIGGGMLGWAFLKKPGGYGLADIPHSFYTVIGHYF